MRSASLAADDLFRCTLCGDCCRGFGGTYVSHEEIRSIAAFLATEPSDLIECCCQRSGGRYLLAQRADGYCIFWDQTCSIHPVKPRMCRRWPFIESVVRDAFNWKIMAAFCPGMRADLPLESVRECIQRILAAEAPESK